MEFEEAGPSEQNVHSRCRVKKISSRRGTLSGEDVRQQDRDSLTEQQTVCADDYKELIVQMRKASLSCSSR